MEEMEQKQARKHGKNPLETRKSSKHDVEMKDNPVAGLGLSQKQLNSPHSKTQKALNVHRESEAEPTAIKAGGVGQNRVEQNGAMPNGVNNTYDHILRTPQSVHVEFETGSAMSSHEGEACRVSSSNKVYQEALI